MTNIPGNSKNDFVADCIRHGLAECRIPIKSVFMVIDDLLHAMKQSGMPSEQVVATKDRSLCCICTKCGWTIDGAGLGTLYMVYKEGVDNVILTGRSEKAQRFLSGYCVSRDCSSQEVILRWRDEYKVTADWILKEFPIK